MKITFGGHKRMTISNQPYEPVQVESVLIIEKEGEEFKPSEIEELQERANRLIDKDLENKIAEALKSQQRTRNKMKRILEDL